MPRVAIIIRSSANVSASSTSPWSSSDIASRFFAMHGPTKTIRNRGPNCFRSSRAVAIIGETMGARAEVRSGKYFST